jgi:hypothetical protein
MINRGQDDKSKPTIRDLYPNLSEQQALEAEENLNRYLQLALQIYERIREDPQLYAEFKNLTASKREPNMHHAKSHPSNNKHRHY